jgi:hypothetical protein
MRGRRYPQSLLGICADVTSVDDRLLIYLLGARCVVVGGIHEFKDSRLANSNRVVS